MKKYYLSLLVLVLVMFGAGVSKVEAGLSNAQVNAVINLMTAFGASSSQLQSVYSILQPTALGGTSSAGGGSSTTSSGTTGTTNTTSTSNPGNTSSSGGGSGSSNNGCISNQTAVYAYNIQNGLPCVKACPSVTSAMSNQNYWNVVTNSICPAYVPPTLNTSITLGYPNGGETFSAGDSITLKWETENIPDSNDNIFILLNYYNANNTWLVNTVLAQDENNDGWEEVILPSTLPAGAMWGNHFKISIGTTDNSGNSLGTDYSDDFFTIEE